MEKKRMPGFPLFDGKLRMTEDRREFFRDLRTLALPVTLQCLLQSSFSVVDQVMTGQLGNVSVAAVGLSGKFISLFSVMVQALAAMASIVIAQAVGKGDKREECRGFFTSLLFSLVLAAGFSALCLAAPHTVMQVYSQDAQTVDTAASYLRIYAAGFFPFVLYNLCAAWLRCRSAAMFPLYAGICSALLNTALNYVLIFGNAGFPAMGVEGAAIASVIAQWAGALVVAAGFFLRARKESGFAFALYRRGAGLKKYLVIFVPMFACKLFWILGENAYAFVYGHMGTDAAASMTLINPVVSLTIGAMTGISQAAGILTGRCLGAGDPEKAKTVSRRLLATGLAGSVFFSGVLALCAPFYPGIFRAGAEVLAQTGYILYAYAVLLPVKVLNMILCEGILRSGGKTKYVMWIYTAGAWGVGVPLAFLSAFAFGLPVYWVYFILSQEETVRLVFSLVVFRRGNWMQRL